MNMNLQRLLNRPHLYQHEQLQVNLHAVFTQNLARIALRSRGMVACVFVPQSDVTEAESPDALALDLLPLLRKGIFDLRTCRPNGSLP